MKWTVSGPAGGLAAERRGEGLPLLMIQGVGTLGIGWEPLARALGPGVACAWFDNRGLGGSAPAGGQAPLTVPDLAEDALAVADDLGWSSFHVVGHSLGGCIAQAVALRAPSRVRSISQLCTFHRGLDGALPSLRLAWIGLRTALGPLRARRRAFTEILLPHPTPPEERDAVAEAFGPVFGGDLAKRPPVVNQQLRALASWDARDRLGTLKLPSLVVHADQDPISGSATNERLAKALGCPRVCLSQASHGVILTQPERVAPLLWERLRSA